MRDEASIAPPRSGDDNRMLPAEMEFVVPAPAALPARRLIAFGPFRLLPAQQLLMEGETPVRIGSRALEILIALVERPGELVSKGELIARVWPDTVVEESNLKVHVAALRKTIGDGRGGNRYVATTPGRGYRFVAPVLFTEEDSIRSVPQPTREKREHNLPPRLTQLVGRADIIARIATQLPRQQFLTIVGPGGSGKSAVALASADRLIGSYEHGVWLADLASLVDPRLIPSVLASALGLEPLAGDPLPGLIAAMRDKQMLLVLDNCERVIEAVAALVMTIRREARRVHILATSREPLRADGEHVHRLQPLASPPLPATDLTAAEALIFPAVQLFVESAGASVGEFELSDSDAPFVAKICSKLDGIPLAIEFAAARVDAFGVRGVASRLDGCLRLLTNGHRTALPRHRTMRATLDWSYELLPELERVVLQRLAVFASAFSLEEASAIVASKEIIPSEIADTIVNLVEKSLVTADVGGTMVRYRLLETTRAYAVEKLAESGERGRFARRHADYCRNQLGAALQNTGATAQGFALCRPAIDSLRSIFGRAFCADADPSISGSLAAAPPN